MPDDDFFDDEAAGFGEPVHPDDRLWRHPSELHKVPPPGARSIPDTVDFAPAPLKRSVWGAIAASSLVGAAVAVTVIMMTGVGERVVQSEDAATSSSLPVDYSTSTSTSNAVSTTEPPPPETTPIPPDLSDVAATAAPSLTWITVVDAEGSTDCAGVVITSDGHLITDSQPFSDDATITVRFHDGTVATGELVGIDPLTELAVIRVDRDDLVPAELGDPRQLRAGTSVLLLAPDEAGNTAATAAMVNATGTPARVGQQATLYDMIQFDAPVPSDMSGGPLLNDEGQVVGVTVRAGNGEPYGLATPIDSASIVAADLISVGKARHPWLGVEGRQEDAEPLLIKVFDESPAALAGLEAGDVILAVDDEPVPSMAAFVTEVRAHRPGDEITITYRRDDIELDCVVVLGER